MIRCLSLSGRKVAGFKFPQTLSLVIGPSNNSDWYLRSWLSSIQILTLEFKIPFTWWEVSMVRFLPLIHVRASGANKAIMTITLSQCGHPCSTTSNFMLRDPIGCCWGPQSCVKPLFMTNKSNSDPVGKLKAGACRRAVWRTLKAFTDSWNKPVCWFGPAEFQL